MVSSVKTYVFESLNPKRNKWQGIVATLIFIGFGAFLIYKHRKEQGFWWGFLALALLSTYIIISPEPVVAAPEISKTTSES